MASWLYALALAKLWLFSDLQCSLGNGNLKKDMHASDASMYRKMHSSCNIYLMPICWQSEMTLRILRALLSKKSKSSASWSLCVQSGRYRTSSSWSTRTGARLSSSLQTMLSSLRSLKSHR